MFQRIDHWALHLADVGPAAEFYIQTFGFEKYFDGTGATGRRIFLRLGDTIMELTTHPGGETMSGFHLCLTTIDFDVALAALIDRKLPVVTPAQTASSRDSGKSGWRRAVFRGPHGELIEIRGRT